MDVHYENQKLYCKQNNLPMFAPKSCNHMETWINDDRYGNLQTLGEMLFEKYGQRESFKISTGTHIISCPICGKSWCD